jgi:hypothetical protein
MISFTPQGSQGYRPYPLTNSEALPGTVIVPPPPISLSVSPLFANGMTEELDRMCPRRRLPLPRSYLRPPFGRTSLYRPRRSQRDHARAARVDGFNPCAIVETSAGNFQAWLRHRSVFPRLLGTFAAQILPGRYGADPNAADWRRFGRFPGFTSCKPKSSDARALDKGNGTRWSSSSANRRPPIPRVHRSSVLSHPQHVPWCASRCSRSIR